MPHDLCDYFTFLSFRAVETNLIQKKTKIINDFLCYHLSSTSKTEGQHILNDRKITLFKFYPLSKSCVR